MVVIARMLCNSRSHMSIADAIAIISKYADLRALRGNDAEFFRLSIRLLVVSLNAILLLHYVN